MPEAKIMREDKVVTLGGLGQAASNAHWAKTVKNRPCIFIEVMTIQNVKTQNMYLII